MIDAPTNPLQNVPDTLRQLDQWVAWRSESRDDGAATKVPYSPATGKRASSTAANTWTGFKSAAGAEGYDGPGFVFVAGGGLVGMDLDGCRNPQTGEIANWAREVIQQFDTYTEISPSQTGVKLFLRGESPLSSGKKKLLPEVERIADKSPAIEVYDRGRYFAVTGLILDGCPSEPQERQAELTALVNRYWPERTCAKNCTGSNPGKYSGISSRPNSGNSAGIIDRPNSSQLGPISSKRLERARKYIAKMPAAISGSGGHDRTFAVACALCIGFDLGPDDALDLLREYNERCEPPWGDHDLEHKIASAMRADGERGHLLVAERAPATRGKRKPAEKPQNFAELKKGVLSNAERVGEGQDQETIPKSLAEILGNIQQITGGWPRRVGATLFIDDPAHGLGHFTKIDQLFGWLSSTAAVEWYKSTGCVSRGEVFAELQRTAQAYRAIEAFPHFPPFADHYYRHPQIKLGGGEYLRALLDRFAPATPIDRDLIQAMFASAVWGGDGGSRPAFVVASDDGRGVGKTTLVEAVGQLMGGMFAISKDDRAGDIAKRLLTPEAATKRVVGFDNVKQNKLSWGELEAFITAREISGHQMYSGERTRPNTLLWCITLNGPALSKDMAQRSVIIKLAKPTHTGDWEDGLRDFIETHRWRIMGDLAAFLNGPAEPLAKHTRWGKWERDILARLPEPTEAQTVIAERQAAVDVDDEESRIIEDAFRQELERLGYDPDSDAVHIPNVIAREWYVKATGIQTSTTGAMRAINQAATEGTLHGLKLNPSRTHGRGVLWAMAGFTAVAYDLEQRIREHSWRGQVS